VAYLVDEMENYHPLNLPLETRIGRGEGNHIQISHDLHVSRRHAVIIYDEEKGEFKIKDLGSKHGTYVNGEKIEGERVIKNGDHIRLGKETRLIFKVL